MVSYVMALIQIGVLPFFWYAVLCASVPLGWDEAPALRLGVELLHLFRLLPACRLQCGALRGKLCALLRQSVLQPLL
jgi:hypothetical protein